MLSKTHSVIKHISKQKPVLTVLERSYSSAAQDNVLQSTFPPINIPKQNLTDHTTEKWDTCSDYTAIQCSVSGKQFSYADVRMMTRQFGAQLINSGFYEDDICHAN